MKKLYPINVLLLLLLVSPCSFCTKRSLEERIDLTAIVRFQTNTAIQDIDDVALLVFDKAGRYLETVTDSDCGLLDDLSASLNVRSGEYTILAFLNKDTDYFLSPQTMTVGSTPYSELEVMMHEITKDKGTMLFGCLQNVPIHDEGKDITINLSRRGKGKIFSFGITVLPWVEHNVDVEL